MTHAVRLRPTMLFDLDYVVGVEQDEANRPYITPWERTQHEGAVRIPDFRHFIVESGANYTPAGFVILQGCRNANQSVELKRIVLQPKGQGLGEMSAEQLWDTTLNPETRRLLPVTWGELDFAATEGSFNKLMGKGEAASRRELMELHGNAVEVDV